METIPNLSPAEIAAMPLTCDVCTATPDDGLWVFRYNAFTLITLDPLNPMRNLTINAPPGDWGVCQFCAQAVLARDTALIWRISARAHGRENTLADELMRAFFRILVPNFRDEPPRWITRR